NDRRTYSAPTEADFPADGAAGRAAGPHRATRARGADCPDRGAGHALPGPTEHLAHRVGPAALGESLPSERLRRPRRYLRQRGPQLLPGSRWRRQHHRVYPEDYEAVLTVIVGLRAFSRFQRV